VIVTEGFTTFAKVLEHYAGLSLALYYILGLWIEFVRGLINTTRQV
jgi:hypothetical protein